MQLVGLIFLALVVGCIASALAFGLYKIAQQVVAVLPAHKTRALPAPSPAPAPVSNRWQAGHTTKGGKTVIWVRLGSPNYVAGGAGEQEIMTIDSAVVDPEEFDAKFLEGMAEARERAALFNSELDDI